MMATTSFMVRPSLFSNFGRGAIGFRSQVWHHFVQMTQKVATRNENPLVSCASCAPLIASRVENYLVFALRAKCAAKTRSLALAKRTFLRDRSHQGAVLLEDHAAGKPSAALRARRILRIQQPFVGAERP